MIRVLRKIFELAYGDYLTLEYVRSAHSRSLGDSISGSNTYNTNDVFAEIWQVCVPKTLNPTIAVMKSAQDGA